MGDSKDVGILIDAPSAPTRSHTDGETVVKKDKTPTLIQNIYHQFKFVPRYLADELQRELKAIIITPEADDYVACYKMGLGYREDVGSDATIQINGKWIKPEQLGAVDVAALIKKAEQEAKSIKGKKGKIVKATEIPGGEEGTRSFGSRMQRLRFGR